MNPGDVCLILIPQVGGGAPKLRPALILATLPGPYQTLLVCGISSQLHTIIPDWDELIQPSDTDFASSGLHQASIIRLSFLYATQPTEITGVIGAVEPDRLDRLLMRLSDHVRP
jgi:mRNA interferase MazF